MTRSRPERRRCQGWPSPPQSAESSGGQRAAAEADQTLGQDSFRGGLLVGLVPRSRLVDVRARGIECSIHVTKHVVLSDLVEKVGPAQRDERLRMHVRQE